MNFTFAARFDHVSILWGILFDVIFCMCALCVQCACMHLNQLTCDIRIISVSAKWTRILYGVYQLLHISTVYTVLLFVTLGKYEYKYQTYTHLGHSVFRISTGS